MTTRRQFLRTLGAGLAASRLPGARAATAAPEVHDRPNVIMIMADDLGYECLRCNGSPSYDTPNLDRLARTGMRFTHAYVNPLCTPTRVALMTGRYNFRNYERFGTLPHGERTFAHMVKSAGYATCIVGKWQLGDGGGKGQDPTQAGFDEHFMKIDNDSKGYADPVIYSDEFEPRPFPGAYGPDLFADYLGGFLERHRDVPFFVYYPMFLTHFDFKPTPDSDAWHDGDRHEKSTRFFPDMVAYMDKNIGRIVSKLEALGLRDRTLLLFVGDNGTQRSIRSPWRGKMMRGGKSRLTEAGTHVPMIANWPGTIPAGRVVDALVDPTDFLPTIAEATGAALPRPSGDGMIDGASFLPVLKGEKPQVRDWILIEYSNEQRSLFRGQEGRYVRDHRWKLYDRGTSRRGEPFYNAGQLFDMVADPQEQHPIALGSGGDEAQAARRKLQAVLDKVEQRAELQSSGRG